MKKVFVLLAAILIALGFAACSGASEAAPKIDIDYGESDIYSKADMDAAIALIQNEFSTWEGCELHEIRYTSDECNSEENIEWMNDLGDGNTEFTQCIEFESDFHSPKNGGGAWEADTEYRNWQWWLARTDDGEWNLMTWGF